MTPEMIIGLVVAGFVCVAVVRTISSSKVKKPEIAAAAGAPLSPALLGVFGLAEKERQQEPASRGDGQNEERVRAPPHEPFEPEHLHMMAADHGWTIHEQGPGLYLLQTAAGELVLNPYAARGQPQRIFNHRDLEDFLLTC